MSSLISVIIPVYNVEKFLVKCIDSVISQSYTNLEILLIDDGSTDGSGKICDSYAQKDNRIKVIHKINGGLSSARNLGLDNASGEYIAFIDSDDFVKKNFIQILYERLIIDKSDISVCNFERIDESGNSISEFPLIKSEEKMIQNRKEFWESFFHHGAVNVVAWNKLYKKKIFDSIRYFEGHIHEDIFIIPEIIECVEKISFTTEPLYCYLKRSDSIVGNVKNKHVFDIDKIFADLLLAEYFEKNGYFEMFSHHLLDVIIDTTENVCKAKLTKKEMSDFQNIHKRFSLLYIRNYKDFSKRGIKFHVYMQLFCFNVHLFYIIYSILKCVKNMKKKVSKHG
ncbi:MAG: glycosyltransferase [Treponema sp.]|nr:glycosyltransferase [Treponema sp.]